MGNFWKDWTAIGKNCWRCQTFWFRKIVEKKNNYWQLNLLSVYLLSFHDSLLRPNSKFLEKHHIWTSPSKLSAGQLIALTSTTCPQLPVQPGDGPLVLVPLRDLQFQLQVRISVRNTQERACFYTNFTKAKDNNLNDGTWLRRDWPSWRVKACETSRTIQVLNRRKNWISAEEI